MRKRAVQAEFWGKVPLNHANGLMSWELLVYDLALKNGYLQYMGQHVSSNECQGMGGRCFSVLCF